MKSRIFITGDKHGRYDEMIYKLNKLEVTKDDVVIILGDHGTLYYGPDRDKTKRNVLSRLPCTFVLIHGNHDCRPTTEGYGMVPYIATNVNMSGSFWRDENYPNLLYTNEYGWYRFGSKDVFVIGGAYSVDKHYRLEMQKLGFKDYKWFSDEQLSREEKESAVWLLQANPDYSSDHVVLLTHTCPYKYRPIDMFLPSIKQSDVDDSMEQWLDLIERNINYEKWYCGHWHTDRTIDKMRFMYNDIELFDEEE